MSVRYELAFNEGTGTSIAEASGGTAAVLQAGGTWVAGNTGNAVVSATSNLPAAIVTSPGLSTNTWTGITIMLWLKYNSSGVSASAVFEANDAANGNDIFGIYLNTTTTVSGWVNSNVNTSTDTPSYTHGWTNGTWHHVAITWSAVSGTLTLWTDGTLRTSIALAGATVQLNAVQLELGNVWWNPTGGCKAAVDDFRLYDNELNSTQINTAKNTPVGVVAIPPILVMQTRRAY